MAYLRFLERINRVLAPIGIGAMLIMMTIVTLNVLGRAAINAPIFGTVEVVELSGVIMASFIIAYTQERRQNITVKIVVDRLPPRLQGAFDTVTLLIGLVFVGLIAWTSSAFGLQFPEEMTDTFEVPRLPFRLIWVFGCVVLFLVLAGQFIQSLAKAVKKWTP
jgi:TRAP-type C4-dicarboxylate transport system permease small subunit